MTGGPGAPTPPASASSEPPARRVVLDIDPGSDPISGEIDDGRGARRFRGWLELAEALQSAGGSREEGSRSR